MNNEHEHIYDDCIGNPPQQSSAPTEDDLDGLPF